MTDLSNLPTGATAEPLPDTVTLPDTVIRYKVPNIDGEFVFDVSDMPTEARYDMLKGAVRAYIANRVNAAHQRYTGSEEYKAWALFDKAKETDPLTSLEAPSHPRPEAPDLNETHSRAIEDLKAGTMRRRITGEPKERKVKDPFIKEVTDKAVKRLYERTRKENPKYTFFEAKSAVGPDGVAYLKQLIDDYVAQGEDRAELEKSVEIDFFAPARLAVGIDANPKMKNLRPVL